MIAVPNVNVGMYNFLTGKRKICPTYDEEKVGEKRAGIILKGT